MMTKGLAAEGGYTMNRLHQQAIQAVLNDLHRGVAPAITDATAGATLDMSRHILAFVVVNQQNDGPPPVTMAEELEVLDEQERRERALLESLGEDSSYLAIDAEMVTPYVRKKLGCPEAAVVSLRQVLGGFSKVTYIAKLTGADEIGNALVIRRDAEFKPVALRSAEEFPILHAVHALGVDAPEPLWADDAWPFGGSILASRLAPGASVYDGSATRIGPGGEEAALALARSLAGLHRLPLSAVDLPSVDAKAPLTYHVARTLDMLQTIWDNRRLVESPVINRALSWARENIPADGPGPVIVHGDASLRNYLYDAASGTGSLLDWELWHVGDPTEDLECCRPEIEQVMPWSSFMDAYEAAGGAPYRADIASFYDLLIPLWQAINTAAVLHGVRDMSKPEVRGPFVGSYHYRRLVREVAKRLAILIEAD